MKNVLAIKIIKGYKIALIHLVNNSCTPFVIANGYNEARQDWAYGNYYSDIISAVADFKKAR